MVKLYNRLYGLFSLTVITLFILGGFYLKKNKVEFNCGCLEPGWWQTCKVGTEPHSDACIKKRIAFDAAKLSIGKTWGAIKKPFVDLGNLSLEIPMIPNIPGLSKVVNKQTMPDIHLNIDKELLKPINPNFTCDIAPPIASGLYYTGKIATDSWNATGQVAVDAIADAFKRLGEDIESLDIGYNISKTFEDMGQEFVDAYNEGKTFTEITGHAIDTTVNDIGNFFKTGKAPKKWYPPPPTKEEKQAYQHVKKYFEDDTCDAGHIWNCF